MSFADRLQAAWWRRPASGLASWLAPLSSVFAALVNVRRLLHRLGLSPEVRMPVPVVVVGNLVVGGAGKTPTVIAVVDWLRQAGRTPGVISRGYGRSGEGVAETVPGSGPSQVGQVGDEPLLIHLRTRAPVFVGRDRVAAATALLAAHPSVDVIVSDDGLQHLRLGRDVQVIVFDDRGPGNGRLLPAGPLREPVPAMLPPRTLVLYNAPLPTTALPGHAARRSLAGAVSLAHWWQGHPPDRVTLGALRGRTVWACAGMASPERFFRMLEDEGLQVVRCPLPDHFDYASLPWPADVLDVLVTEKDAVKLPPGRTGATRVWVVALDLAPPEVFFAELQRLLPRQARSKP